MNGAKTRRVLSLSTLFPSTAQPRFGIFVAKSLEALQRLYRASGRPGPVLITNAAHVIFVSLAPFSARGGLDGRAARAAVNSGRHCPA